MSSPSSRSEAAQIPVVRSIVASRDRRIDHLSSSNFSVDAGLDSAPVAVFPVLTTTLGGLLSRDGLGGSLRVYVRNSIRPVGATFHRSARYADVHRRAEFRGFR